MLEHEGAVNKKRALGNRIVCQLSRVLKRRCVEEPRAIFLIPHFWESGKRLGIYPFCSWWRAGSESGSDPQLPLHNPAQTCWGRQISLSSWCVCWCWSLVRLLRFVLRWPEMNVFFPAQEKHLHYCVHAVSFGNSINSWNSLVCCHLQKYYSN